MDFFELFRKYKEEIINRPIDIKDFLLEQNVPKESIDSMSISISIMIDNEKKSANSPPNQGVDKMSITQAIPEESKYEDGRIVVQETSGSDENLDASNRILQQDTHIDSNVNNAIIDHISILSDKSNWSKLTTTGNEYKIYEVIQEENNISIVGLVIADGKNIPIKWDMFGINSEHSIIFNNNFTVGDSIVVSTPEGNQYARVFNKCIDGKFITFDSINNLENNSTDEILGDSWDFALPWDIYMKIINLNKKEY